MTQKYQIIFSIVILAAITEILIAVDFYLPIFSNLLWKSNLGIIITTLLVGSLALILYFKQKFDNKRDAARLILQEIRRAEDIISDYKQSGAYQFAKKIIATNSWNKNINFFVGDLENDELDKISNLYSTGEYLDGLIKEISDITLKDEIEIDKKSQEIELKHQSQKPITLEGSTYPIAQINEPIMIRIIGIRPVVWRGRLDAISLKLSPIYDSSIGWKLKKIAKLI